MDLLTKDQIVGATDVQPEEARRRRRRFVDYQERGLIGQATSKQPRQGGAGLWHPTQAELWRLYDRQKGSVRPLTLANAPVGLWLGGISGIELEQVQRAFHYWVSEAALLDRPQAGERSGYRRRLHVAANAIADPQTTKAARRRLRKVIENIADSGGTVFDRAVVETAVLDALSNGDGTHLNDRIYSSSYFRGLSWRFLAISHVETLTRHVSDELWLWARTLIRATYPAYQQEHVTLKQQPRTGRFYSETPDSNYFLNESCSMLLLTFGIGISVLNQDPLSRLPPELPPPPRSLIHLYTPR